MPLQRETTTWIAPRTACLKPAQTAPQSPRIAAAKMRITPATMFRAPLITPTITLKAALTIGRSFLISAMIAAPCWRQSFAMCASSNCTVFLICT